MPADMKNRWEEPDVPQWLRVAAAKLARRGLKRRRVNHLVARCIHAAHLAGKRERGKHDRWRTLLLIQDLKILLKAKNQIAAIYSTTVAMGGA